MKKVFLIFLITLTTYLNAGVKSVSVSELEKLLEIGIKVIDIRKPNDLAKTGIIPTSFRLNFYDKDGKINRTKWLNAFIRLVKDSKIKFVLVSTNGEKAELGANLLYDLKGYKNPYYLEGGINSWIDDKKKLIQIKNKDMK